MGGIGLLWFWGGFELWRATARAVTLTDSALVDSSGAEIATLSGIVAVERGMISMKPSNGMLLKLSQPGPARWVPGLWWRVGARVGIGGLTGKGQTRHFADLLETRLMPENETR